MIGERDGPGIERIALELRHTTSQPASQPAEGPIRDGGRQFLNGPGHSATQVSTKPVARGTCFAHVPLPDIAPVPYEPE